MRRIHTFPAPSLLFSQIFSSHNIVFHFPFTTLLYLLLLRILFIHPYLQTTFFHFYFPCVSCSRWMVSLWSALIHPAAAPPGFVSSSVRTPVSYLLSLQQLPHPLQAEQNYKRDIKFLPLLHYLTLPRPTFLPRSPTKPDGPHYISIEKQLVMEQVFFFISLLY